jgi:hypothetical protein
VQRFGLRLLPEICEACNPMTYDVARDMVRELAIDLREEYVGIFRIQRAGSTGQTRGSYSV